MTWEQREQALTTCHSGLHVSEGLIENKAWEDSCRDIWTTLCVWVSPSELIVANSIPYLKFYSILVPALNFEYRDTSRKELPNAIVARVTETSVITKLLQTEEDLVPWTVRVCIVVVEFNSLGPTEDSGKRNTSIGKHLGTVKPY